MNIKQLGVFDERIQEVKKLLAVMSRDQLKEVNRLSREFLKQDEAAYKNTFKVGDRVILERKGWAGTIEKINKTRIIVKRDGMGLIYSCSPSLLVKANNRVQNC